jgi:uncharacterized tellurite resistance protein B-like protein
MGDEEILNLFDAVIARALPDADRKTQEITMAVTGLMAAVAVADRNISPDECRLLASQLDGLEGFDSKQADAVAEVIEQHASRLSITYTPHFTRTVRGLLPEDARIKVLDDLIRMAAADGGITPEEVIKLRNITQAIGLSQTCYNELEDKYRKTLRKH